MPHEGSRASTRETCIACHRPLPAGLGTRRLLSAAAMPYRLVMPAASSARARRACLEARRAARVKLFGMALVPRLTAPAP